MNDVAIIPTMKPIGLEKAENGDLSKEITKLTTNLRQKRLTFQKLK